MYEKLDVPRRSLLGPTLFVIIINDMHVVVDNLYQLFEDAGDHENVMFYER